ncbi:MAG TPA: carboxymuconolactone decarboxylase family protein, partial [Terriglobales bacterium]|nr:carboxymuconolactone decarboxylase family protein [Terriglobales bacterium]
MSFLREVQLGNEFGAFVVLQEALGFIPNLLRAQTLLPRVIEAQAKLEMAVRPRQGAISSVQKERMLLSVAANREDSYCVALESKVLSSLGVPDSQLDDFLNDYIHAGLSAPDLACLQFCIKLSCHALSISSKDIEVLRAWGFEDESILEAVFVTALAVYRCTLSVGLAPEPDFGSRKCPSTRFDPPHKAVVEGLSPKAHTTDRKGPYVSAPYLSPKRFAPFSIVQQSHGFIPNFFRAQTLRPDLLGAELEAEGRILQPEDVLTRMQKECILLAVSAANLNSYCVAVHCNLLRGLGMPPEEGDQIAVDHHQSGLSEADKALV